MDEIAKMRQLLESLRSAATEAYRLAHQCHDHDGSDLWCKLTYPTAEAVDQANEALGILDRATKNEERT